MPAQNVSGRHSQRPGRKVGRRNPALALVVSIRPTRRGRPPCDLGSLLGAQGCGPGLAALEAAEAPEGDGRRVLRGRGLMRDLKSGGRRVRWLEARGAGGRVGWLRTRFLGLARLCRHAARLNAVDLAVKKPDHKQKADAAGVRCRQFPASSRRLERDRTTLS